MSDLMPRLSVHALRTWDTCPRQFALRYRLNRYWPAPEGHVQDAEGERRKRLGEAFHRLVEYQMRGLDPSRSLVAWLPELPELEAMWRTFVASPETRIPPGASAWTEQALHAMIAGVPVMARYDRIVQTGERWQILDWKTGNLAHARLVDDWQTRLYPFLLVEAGSALGKGPIAPNQVEMVYVQVKGHDTWSLDHSTARHEATRRELERRAAAAVAPFDPALHDDPAFPRNPSACERCPYDTLCNARTAEPVLAHPVVARFALTEEEA
jgi:hypothetical protein